MTDEQRARRAVSAKKYRTANREKRRLWAAEWRRQNPEKSKAYAADYRKRHLKQVKAAYARWSKSNPDKCSAARRNCVITRTEPPVCEICGLPESQKGRGGNMKRLAVDHCHATGKFRGWLCHRCNLTIGSMHDSPELLIKAAQYLKGALT